MLTMSLTSRVGDPSDPGAVLVAIEKGLAFLDMGDTTVGHVTVLKRLDGLATPVLAHPASRQ